MTLVTLPRCPISKILKLKSTLVEAGTPYVNESLTKDKFQRFCSDLTEAFSMPMYQRDIEKSLLSLANTKLLQDDLELACWRLAAHLPTLLAFSPVSPWEGQVTEEWMPLQVVEATPHFYRAKQPGAIFTFRILAGTAAGMLTHRFWTHRFCAFLADSLGFSKRWGRYPFKTEEQLSGLRLWGLFTPELCAKENVPKFDKVRIPPSMQAFNRDRIRARFPKQPKYTCSLNIACHTCPLGKDRCAQATHLRTYVEGLCAVCCQPNALFDPKHMHKGRCLDCDLKWKRENCQRK